MKFHEYAHHLFDAMRRRRVIMSMIDRAKEMEARENLARRLPEFESTPLYVLREPANVVVDDDLRTFARERLRDGRLTLPFPRMLLQITLTDTHDPDHPGVAPAPDVWIILATREDALPDTPVFRHFLDSLGPGAPDDIWIQMFETTLDALDEWLQPGAFSRASVAALKTYATNAFAGTPDDMRQHSNRVMEAAKFLCSVLAMLDSPSIEIEPVKVPKEINRGRRLMKRPQIPDHTVIRLPKLVYASAGEDKGGTHKRPRPHWRRPHRREFKPGKFTEIPLTLVAKRPDEPPPPPPVVELVTLSVTDKKEPAQ
jgi:hypothetical protein